MATLNKKNVRVINFTPHDITFIREGEDGQRETIAVYPASGSVARCATETEIVGDINGIPVTRTAFGKVTVLTAEGEIPMPEQTGDTVYIVSQRTAEALLPRTADIFIPNESVRDEQGRIIGCRSFGMLA